MGLRSSDRETPTATFEKLRTFHLDFGHVPAASPVHLCSRNSRNRDGPGARSGLGSVCSLT
jgi:hypothetical protein